MIEKISAIVSTYNNTRALELCLNSLAKQTKLPTEVIVADDGSTEETSDLIRKMQATSPVTIKHVWQEDLGFRLSLIRNKSLRRATGDYIIMLDGDCVAERHFVEDHARLAREGCYVCGSRVMLPDDYSDKIMTGIADANDPDIPMGYFLNSLRLRPLARLLFAHYKTKDIWWVRGANMAFWRSDLLRVNGYNNDIEKWGHEDVELSFRLHFAGVKKRTIKFAGIVYHLYHQPRSRQDGENQHLKILRQTISNKTIRCENGVEQTEDI